MRARVPLLCFALAIACNTTNRTRDGLPTGGSSTSSALMSLRIEPVDAVVAVDGNAVSLLYSVYGSYADGTTRDLTSVATLFATDPQLITFSGAQLQASGARGGVSTIKASLVDSSIVAETHVTLRVTRTVTDSAAQLPGNIDQAFGPYPGDSGAFASTVTGQLVYPNTDVTIPPNLRKLEFHFIPPAGHQYYELSLTNAITHVRYFVACSEVMSNGCIVTPPPSLWQLIVDNIRGAAGIDAQVRSLNAAGTQLGATNTVRINISNDDLLGALYYWTSSGQAIMRWDFGSTTQTTAEKVVDQGDVGGCPGCHALAPDGKKLILELSGEPWGGNVIFDIAAGQALATAPNPSPTMFESFSPDASKYVGIPGTGNTDADWQLGIYDGATGARLETLTQTGDATHGADFPDWAPSGDRIVYSRAGQAGYRAFMYYGQIEMISDIGGGMWGMPTVLAPQIPGRNNYFPSFAPDGELVAFNQSTCPSTVDLNDCDSYADPSAEVYVVEARPGAQPVRLQRANSPGIADGVTTALTNSYPKWSPFVFTGEKNEFGQSRIEYLSFSSTRRYGLRPQPFPYAMYIWMTAINPDRALQGQDPSSAAFCVPYQDLDTSNHIPQWTQTAVPLIN